MAQFTDLIPQNVAPKEAVRIGVYNGNTRVAGVELGPLAFPSNLGAKLYSFGALSDVHVSAGNPTSEADFRRALTYFQDTEGVAFVCIAGDLGQHTGGQQAAEWALYAQCVEEESENTPVYPVGGNHDANGITLTDTIFEGYTGRKTFYTFTQGNDVFIMLSSTAYPSYSSSVQPFSTANLQQLYEALEANRNKRCFVFQHYFPWGKSGDPLACYSTSNSAFWGTQGQVIYSLMSHYPNALWFHGHSHHMFEMQSIHEMANYDKDFGCHSIHIPSCYMPVSFTASGTRTEHQEGSQGYVVDVYQNAIVLRGRDFEAGKFLPIASYLLDTTLTTVAAGTYTDSTGTITV